MKVEFMEQELISIPFGNSKIDALFYHSISQGGKSEKEPIIIHVHGFLGNFLDGSQRFLPPILAKAGYSSLSVNTRMANFSLFFGFGILEDAVPQIDTAIVFLKELGYKKIILAGYSLGGCIVLRYAALRNDTSAYPSLKGVIALATPRSMPDSIRRRWDKWRSEPAYEDVYKRAKENLKPDPFNASEDRTILIYKARGDTYRPEHTEIYTYKTWWFLAGPEAEGAKAFKQIERIKIPILLIQGWHDDIIDPIETFELAQISLDAGNKDVSAFYVNTGHTLEGKEDELGDIIVKWLDRRFPK
ncbi:MAG: alpha/beta hydrolase [Candidatus Dadabacteria bacterium]|nr:alpha/beta hydrolase [Candidatus Dadabacteria bacterium]